MERLTEKITNMETKEVLAYRLKSRRDEIKAWRKLGEYEDLEEQGLLLRLPCKVGDIVYWLTTKGVLERYVSSMDLIRTNHIAIKLQPLGLDGEICCFVTIVFSEDFGKTLFLTKEEAEAALEKMKGE